MRHIARALRQRDVAAQEAFIGLLSDHEPEVVKKWAAHHALELIPHSQDVEQRALRIIQAIAALDSAESVGERIWLRNWRASNASTEAFIDAVCRLPVDLRTSNRSPVDLLRAVGYARRGVDLRAADLVRWLRENPELLEAWLAYSSDKRVREGWYVVQAPDVTFHVGYYPSGEVFQSHDPAEAVAEFVVRELRSIAEGI